MRLQKRNWSPASAAQLKEYLLKTGSELTEEMEYRTPAVVDDTILKNPSLETVALRAAYADGIRRGARMILELAVENDKPISAESGSFTNL
tara:strand:- start:2734 stop:3006 length:273 start_codon:yes stop_codon:yes gene_type:complete